MKFSARFVPFVLMVFCILAFTAVWAQQPADQQGPASTQRPADVKPRKEAGRQAQPAKGQTAQMQAPEEAPGSTTPGPEAGPQKADYEGRTALPMKPDKHFAFRQIGPAISGGRVTAVAGVPGDPNIYYVGSADGGVFRTDNGGSTWKALFQYESTLSIGALAVDAHNPSLVWAGTGEGNVRNDVAFGDGIYKSGDAGDHWTRMGLEGTSQIARILIDPQNSDVVLVAVMGSPWEDSPERGVFRTTDGGRTWQKTLYLGPSVGVADMAMDPHNPLLVYASTYKYRRTPWSYTDGGPEDAIWRSSDGGQTWMRLSGHGLPPGPVTRIGLAVAASDPNIVYAVMGAKEGVVWRSDDSGEHWNMVGDNQEADVRPFYFSHIFVDPKNADHVFALSMFLMESKDGGKNWAPTAKDTHGDNHAMWIDPVEGKRIIEGNDGGVILSRDNGAHWDFVHNMAIGQLYHVATTEGFRYRTCGGLQDNSAWCGESASKNPQGILDRSWWDLNGGDGIYAIPDPTDPDRIYNSTQNQVLGVFDRRSEQWFDIEPYPRDMGGGGVAEYPYRFNWQAAFAISPANPKVLYAGGNVVFRSEDAGHSWQPISPDLTRNDKSKQQPSGGPIMGDNSGAEVYDTILTIAPSTKDPNVIWVGTDDGLVQLSRDGGAHWSNVTHMTGVPEWGRVECIDPSDSNPAEAVISVDRHFLGDFTPYIFRTTDYGATWHSITGNLPKVYARSARQDPKNPHLYYAGLENGLYVSWDDGARWYLFGLGLPNVSVYDMTFQRRQNDLVLATHGRSVWILDDLTPFQQYTQQLGQEPLHLFPIRPAERFWPWSQIEALGSGAFYGTNPPYGALISYNVGHEVKEPGTLVIKDAQGHVVRTLKDLRDLEAGEELPEPTTAPPSPAKAGAQPQARGQEAEPIHPTTPPASTQAQEQVKPKPSEETAKPGAPKEVPWVPGQPGMHRIAWDLRSDGPVRWLAAKEFNQGPKSGALVPPGEYTATLTLGGQSATEKLTVAQDAASKASVADMQQQYQTELQVLHMISQVDTALNRMDAMQQQLKALQTVVKDTPKEKPLKDLSEKFDKAVKDAQAKLTSNPQAIEGTIHMPDKLREHLFAIMGTLEGSDQAPTPAILEQLQRLQPEYGDGLKAFNDFLQTEVSRANRELEQMSLTGLVAGEALQQ